MKLECYFCGSEKIRIPEIGLAFGMCGNDYSFCYKCLKNMTADKFWRQMFKKHGFRYPPKSIKDMDQ